MQYTVPIEQALNAVRNGENPSLTSRQSHKRVCYVVAEDGADKTRIEKEIVSMPYYFDAYDTEVNFISAEMLAAEHSAMPHGGLVFRTGGGEQPAVMEYKLTLSSNPHFTASVLVAFARAVHRLSNEGKSGAYTCFDVPLAYLSPKSHADLLKEML